MSHIKTHSLTQDEKKKIISVIKSFLENNDKIIFAYVFGSFVDSEIPFFRDIDIGIYVKDYRDSDWYRYEIELPLALESLLDYRYQIDIAVINTADIFLVKNVINGELIFTKDEDLWADFVVYHGKMYASDGKRILYYMKEAIFG